MESTNKIIDASYKFKKKYFKKFSNIDLNKIKITTQGEYSMSSNEASDKLIHLIKKYFRTNKLTITDATGNNGADTISLGLNFDNVNSIEIDQLNFSVLQNNINVYNLKNVKLYFGDSTELLSKLKQDVVYIDAPWRGKNYKDKQSIKLFMSNLEISDIYNKFKKNANLFIFKVPKNYDFSYFISNTLIEKYYIHSYVKNDTIKFYFIIAPCHFSKNKIEK